MPSPSLSFSLLSARRTAATHPHGKVRENYNVAFLFRRLSPTPTLPASGELRGDFGRLTPTTGILILERRRLDSEEQGAVLFLFLLCKSEDAVIIHIFYNDNI